MRLLVVSHGLGTVDRQSFFAELEEQTGWSVTLVLPARWETQFGPVDMTGRRAGLKAEIRYLDVVFPGSVRGHVYRGGLVGLLREIAPDAIYVDEASYSAATAQVYLANQLAGRCPIGCCGAQDLVKRPAALTRRLERWVLDHSSFIFPASEGALELLRAKHYSGAAEVLPAAIDPEIYHPEPALSASRRALMGFAPNRVIFGYMGRLIEEKGLGVLLSAVEQMGDVPWELILVGGGPLEMTLRARVTASPQLRGHVHFAGVVPRIEARLWFSMCDVMVLASETRGRWTEPFGRTLVEALACGTPVVGSSSGEIPQVIRATGGGLLFPAGDVPALTAALRRMANDPELRRQFAAEGAASVARIYDQAGLVARFARAIEAATSLCFKPRAT